MKATNSKPVARLIQATAAEWMNEVDATEFVKTMCERFPFGTRPENLGVTPLTNWLKEQGVEAGKAFVMAVRKVWIMDAMRVAEAN